MTSAVSRRPNDAVTSSRTRVWSLLTAIEVALASIAVVLDLLVPTLVLLALAGCSLLVRREGFASLGYHRVAAPGRLALGMFAFAAAWSVFQLGVVLPLANHLSGSEQDLGDFDDLRGNVVMLVALLALSWTLAALGEETAYRGYLQTRIVQLLGSGRAASWVRSTASGEPDERESRPRPDARAALRAS